MARATTESGGNHMTVAGFGVSGLASLLGFIDSNIAGVVATSITLGGMAVIGVWVAWIDRVGKARIKAADEENAANIRRLKEYDEAFRASLKGQVEALTKELEETRAELSNVISDRNWLRGMVEQNRVEIESLKEDLKTTRHALRGEVNTASLKAEVADLKAQKAAEKVKDLKGKLTDSHVIKDDGSGTAEHPTQG